MRRLAIAGAILASALVAPALADDIELGKTTIKAADGSDVPVEIATPAGKGPFPPVLFIHAKRGYEGDERAHVRELAAQGFLVVAPDWQSGRFIERWPSAHDPETELDVEAGLDYLKSLPNACKQPAGIVGLSRGPYYAIRLAAKRSGDIAAIVSYYGHMQNPNAPEPDQLFRVAPEIMQITTPMLMMIGCEGKSPACGWSGQRGSPRLARSVLACYRTNRRPHGKAQEHEAGEGVGRVYRWPSLLLPRLPNRRTYLLGFQNQN